MVLSGRAKAKNAVMIAAMPELNTAAYAPPGIQGYNLVFQNLRIGMRESRVDQVRALRRPPV